MKVLVVDDNADNRYFFESLLKGQGYDVVSADNGANALAKIHNNDISLIISDIMMPVMDGFRLLHECKNDPELNSIPFVFITGVYLDQEDEALAHKLGVKAFLRKPIDPGDFIKDVKAAINNKAEPDRKCNNSPPHDPSNIGMLLEERLTAKLAKKIEELEAESIERKQAEAALLESEARLHALLENTDDAIFSIDRNFRLITANIPAKLHFKEATGHDLIEGREMLSQISSEHRPFWKAMTEKTLQGERSSFIMHYDLPSGSFDVEFSVNPIVSASGYITGFSFFGRDITERLKSSEKLKKNSRLFKMLFLCNEATVHAQLERELLQNICRVLVETGDYPMAWVGYARNDDNKTIEPVAWYGTDTSYLDSINVTWADSERGKGPAGRAVRMGHMVVCQDLSMDTDYQPWYEEALRHGYAGKVSIPLKIEKAVFGVLNIYASQTGFFIKDELTLLQQLAEDISYGIGSLRERHQRKQAEASLGETAEKYRSILDEMDEAYFEIDTNGNYTFFNDSLCRQMGYTREEMTGMNYKVYTPPELRKSAISIFSGVFNTGIPARNVPLINMRKDGTILFTENSLFPIKDAEGKIIGIRGLGHDITGRRNFEQELKKRALLLDSTYDSIIAYNESGDIIYANETTAKIRGYTMEELLSMNINQLVAPEAVGLVKERLKMLSQLGKLSFETVHLTKDGLRLNMDARARSVMIEGARLNISVYRDVTLQKKMQQELIDSETRYRGIIETAGVTVIGVDRHGKLIYVNDLGCETVGYSREEMLGRQFTDFIHPDDRAKFTASFIETEISTAPGQKRLLIELRILHRDGSIIWFYTNPTRLMTSDRTLGFSAVMSNITTLKNTQAALQESEQRYRSLFENNPISVYIMDLNSRFISVNDATCKITGYSREELLAIKPWHMILPEDTKQTMYYFNKALHGEPKTYERSIITKSGKQILLNVTNTAVTVNDKIVGVYGIAEDITERKKAETELKNALETINTTLEGTIEAIAVMSELRDPYTAGHQRIVTRLALAIAHELGLSEHQLQALRVAGLLHDVGKVYVPSEILSKPGKLSDLEKGLTQAHAEAGFNIIKSIKFPWPICRIVLQHHERMDGSGYPNGLKGDEIEIEARILAVADVVEAMMAHRPYRPALGMEKALKEITQNKDTLYYGSAVDACVRLFREKGFKLTE